MMEAVRTSETSVNTNFTTRRYITEDSKLHTRRRENLKSHILLHVKITNTAKKQKQLNYVWKAAHGEHYAQK
jgi:hypothetical protein